jgi:ATP-dependent Clp protease ATP-binding subunit ClpC
MFERFTNQSRRVVVLAQEEARKLDHNYIGTEHILLGLLHEGKGSAAHALMSMGVTLEAARSQVELIIGPGQAEPPKHIPFTPRAKKSLELSLREALQLSHHYIGTGHLLLGLMHQDDNMAVRMLGNLHVDLKDLRARVISEMAEHPDQNDEATVVTHEPPSATLRQRSLVRGLLDTIDARLSAIEEHLGITRPVPDEVRQLDEKIASVRRDKESAVDVQDFAQAAMLRDAEKQLLAERQRVITEMETGAAQAAEPTAAAADEATAGAADEATAGAAETDQIAEAGGTAGDDGDPSAAAG